ncbi:unnamed protein product, partial [Acidithrix sp. C25]
VAMTHLFQYGPMAIPSNQKPRLHNPKRWLTYLANASSWAMG